jgi:DNA-binding NtrC family response regulator
MIRKDMPILVIDRQAYWRRCAAKALRSAGYLVSTLANYDEVLSQALNQQKFALVLVGCPTIERAERLLITRLLMLKQHVVVLVTSLPAMVMRALFIRGVEDAADKTYDASEIVTIVEQALERIPARKHLSLPAERGIPYE